MNQNLNFKAAWMQRQVDQAQAMFQRVLVTWAGDVLELRRTGRAAPTWGDGGSWPGGFASGGGFGQGPLLDEPMNDAA